MLHLDDRRTTALEAARCQAPGKVLPGVFRFPSGTLLLTEAGTKHRAALYLVAAKCLRDHDPGGLEPLTATFEQFDAALRRENHTLKRALTDPRLFSGVGNAYSDEILHRARLSPLALTQKLKPDEAERLFAATREALVEWTDRLRAETGDGFPEKVTAFRPGHGGPRSVRRAVSRLRRPRPADPLRRQRDELLPEMPDRRPHPRRPLALAIAEGRLAAITG